MDAIREREIARFGPQQGYALAAAAAYALAFAALGGFSLEVAGGAALLGLVVAWLLARPRRALTTRRVVVRQGGREESVLLSEVASVSAAPLLGRVVVRPRDGKPLVLRGIRRPREAARLIERAASDRGGFL